MEFIIVEIIIFIAIIILKYIFGYNVKQLKYLGEDQNLDELAKKYPSNVDMCKDYLKRLKNENVKIEESKDMEASLYIAITNKILIANIQNSYTRIQTIAHECLHSVQNRKILLFNFIFSNIYLVYFLIVCILAILRLLPFKMMFVAILLILSMIYCVVRIYLENDAMIKARYLAKDYMEDIKVSSEKEIQQLVAGFDKINSVGIKCINYKFFLDSMFKVFDFILLCIIF